jgi:hypothetical protein
MTCLDSGPLKEFEFYQSLSNNPDKLSCAGPKTPIGFTQDSLEFLIEVLDRLHDNVDTFEPQMLDSSCTVLQMCAKHWILKTEELVKHAYPEDADLVFQLKLFIFNIVCLANEWDFKEILNYTKNIIPVEDL